MGEPETMPVDVPEVEERWEGAEYPGISIKYEDVAHKYLVNGEKFPSVTTILNKHVAKEAIARWTETKTCEGVEALMRSEAGCPLKAETIQAALYANGLTADQEKQRKGKIGDDVHGALNEYVETGELFKLDSDIPEARPYRQALARFIVDADPEILSSEVLVASTRHRYAGRYDLRLSFLKPTKLWVAVTQKDARPELIVVRPGTALFDAKTANNIYPEVGLQLAGYEQASIECGMQPTRYRMALHLKPDGTYVVHIFATNRGDFTSMAQTYHRFLAMNRRRTKLTKTLERAA